MPISFVQGLANCRNFGIDSVINDLCFQLLTMGLQLRSTLVGCDAGEGPDAEDHEEGKRRSGL
jgi:hypothetical protein